MIKFIFNHGLTYYPKNNKFENCSPVDALRYLKGLYTNEARFINKFLKAFEKTKELKELYDFFKSNYSDCSAYSYEEAFRISNESFKALVFGSINISEMINNLGSSRIAVEGMPVKRKTYDKAGNFIGIVEYDNIYETYKINGKKLGVEYSLYAVKCWCTSTNKEHWLWIEDKYKDSPKSAIASTFRFHKNIIPYIKEMKRQGDTMLVELTHHVEPQGEIVPLTAEQYFSLLTSES